MITILTIKSKRYNEEKRKKYATFIKIQKSTPEVVETHAWSWIAQIIFFTSIIFLSLILYLPLFLCLVLQTSTRLPARKVTKSIKVKFTQRSVIYKCYTLI